MGTTGPRSLALARALAMACLCLGLFACAGMNRKDDTKDPARLEQRADEAASQGEVQAALTMYAAALEHGAKKPGVRLKMARIFFSQADYAAAAQAFEDVLAAQPGDPEALWGAGYSYFSLAEPEAAQAKLTELAARQPDMAQAHHLLGVLANLARQPAKALPELERARQLDPADPDIANNLGLAQFMAGRYAEAAGSFRFALRQKPSARTSNNLGLALCRLGRIEEAFEAFKAGSGEAVAYNNAGVCLEEAGRREAALEYYEMAVTSSPRYFASADGNAARLRTALGGLGESQASPQGPAGPPGIPPGAQAGPQAAPQPGQAARQPVAAPAESILGTPIPVDGPPPNLKAPAESAPRPAKALRPEPPRETPAPGQPRQPAPLAPSPDRQPEPVTELAPKPGEAATPARPKAAEPAPRLPQPVGETPAPSPGPLSGQATTEGQAQAGGAIRRRAYVTAIEQEAQAGTLVLRLRHQGPAPQVSTFFHGQPAALVADIQADAGLRLPQSLALPGAAARSATLARGERGLRLSVELPGNGQAFPAVEVEQAPGVTNILIKSP